MEKKKKETSLKELLEAGCHFGHQSRRWHPRMKSYLYGVRDGVHIFDLVKTKEGLEEASTFLHDKAAAGKTILFVGTKRQARTVIIEEAKRIGVPFIAQRWLGGLITNWDQIKKSVDKLVRMKDEREKGEYKKYTKKEQILVDREINKLERFFGGLVGLKHAPEVLFVVDLKKEEVAVREAKNRDIEVVAVVDSDSNPEMANYVIPCNDDAIGSVRFIVSKVAEAIKEGKEAWEKKAAKEAAKEEKAQAKKGKK